MSGPNAREKLSGSADALFQRFGYTGVSIRDITSCVDIQKGAFYNHFSSKETLASAVLSQHFDALLNTLSRDGNESAGARLRRHFESIAPRGQEPKTSPLQLIITLAAEGPALPPALAQQIAEGIRLWSDQVAALISLAQEQQEIDDKEKPRSTSRASDQLLARGDDQGQMRPSSTVGLSTVRARPRFGPVATRHLIGGRYFLTAGITCVFVR